jgi:uncharacterized membrane protein
MTHQQASAVLNAPLAVVEACLREVTAWPRFLVGLEEVTATTYQRYRFKIKEGKRFREVDVAVQAHPREHRFSWRALSGPRFEGEVRLAPSDERCTRAQLSVTAEPAGFLAGFSEMLGRSDSTAEVCLQQLDTLVTSRIRR